MERQDFALQHTRSRCRVGADRCGVRSWSHHLRAFNKTADAVANLAMDTTCSRQFSHLNSG
ncbi:hypothetical protein PHYSODRAFT_523129 [Phytophthora sojae]|uniref:RNase H type-1 domain-containing protein n=1 Tax=Phytophthora sojae (strain P6497) TaxID=1094619 RepID=G5A4N9_PHYSP|nr:hypothetical protein PHYSODRAFT_523129 [Phytophthora sojae]EGZ09639.1 hypothetical protein PHYSODRAFT_523129 [Phytophthora sojae]|eukprot:XP_009534500.1 hypothetical protein PHYSODRAFT_523129 [Phytophthora sojae]